MLIYVTVKEAFKNADRMQREFEKQKSKQTIITRQNDQLKAALYMDRFQHAQIRAWELLSQQPKLAKQFPKASIWKSIFNNEFRVYS